MQLKDFEDDVLSWVDGPADSDEARVGGLVLRVHPGDSWVVLTEYDTELASGVDGGRVAALGAARDLDGVDLRGLAGWKLASSGKSSWCRVNGYGLISGSDRLERDSWWLIKNSDDVTVKSGRAPNEARARLDAWTAVHELPRLSGIRRADTPIKQHPSFAKRAAEREAQRAAAPKPVRRMAPRKMGKSGPRYGLT
jgi:hypothetical protein